MQNFRISLNDLPPEGKTYTLDDEAIWLTPLAEFGMGYRVSKALSAQLTLLPADGGVLLRGHLTGEVHLPCKRCTEEALAVINADIEDFEELALDEDEAASPDNLDPESRIIWERGAPLLDLAAVCWEEFVLALPVAPLCKPDCKGLCPGCGVSLNEQACSCTADQGDPRLAVLRGLTLRKP